MPKLSGLRALGVCETDDILYLQIGEGGGLASGPLDRDMAALRSVCERGYVG
jgi:hypothetical protein